MPIRSRKHRERLGRKKSLDYSEPNIVGDFIAFSSGTGSFYETSENKGNTMPSTSLDTPRHNRLRFDASRSSALYKNDLAEIRVNALFGLNLIKAF